MRYIVNKEGKVVCTVEMGTPNLKDLASRGEKLVESEENIPLVNAEYIDGKVVRHIKTVKEIAEENEEKEDITRNKLIDERTRKIAEDQLVSEGLIEKKDLLNAE